MGYKRSSHQWFCLSRQGWVMVQRFCTKLCISARVLWSDESSPSKLLSAKDAKASVCAGMGVHQCPRHERLLMSEVDAQVFMGILFRQRWCFFLGGLWLLQKHNATPRFARLPTALLYRHRVCVCVWLACLQSTSVSYWNCTKRHEEENQTATTMNCWAAEFLH